MASILTIPSGDLVSTPPALVPSATTTLGGPPHNILLAPLQTADIPSLWPAVGGLQNAALWTYLMHEPCATYAEFEAVITSIKEAMPMYTIFKDDGQEDGTEGQKENQPVGLIGLLNIAPANRSIEIGHVLFGPSLQRTTAATETVYLLMKYCFEDLGYSRVEWKCNSHNAPSERAAERLGFVYEGEFRKHMVVKGRRRDTKWYSVIDDEWETVKKGLEGWLDGRNFDENGKQRRKLEEIRGGGK